MITGWSGGFFAQRVRSASAAASLRVCVSEAPASFRCSGQACVMISRKSAEILPVCGEVAIPVPVSESLLQSTPPPCRPDRAGRRVHRRREQQRARRQRLHLARDRARPAPASPARRGVRRERGREEVERVRPEGGDGVALPRYRPARGSPAPACDVPSHVDRASASSRACARLGVKISASARFSGLALAPVASIRPRGEIVEKMRRGRQREDARPARPRRP